MRKIQKIVIHNAGMSVSAQQKEGRIGDDLYEDRVMVVNLWRVQLLDRYPQMAIALL